MCVCVSLHPNLRTGTSRRLTEGTSGLSSMFSPIYKGIFAKTASLESSSRSIIILPGSLSSPGDGTVRITLLAQVKKEKKER